jgi:D-sedoheptulose 7-phosphate isomerase
MRSIIKNEINDHIKTSEKVLDSLSESIELASILCIDALKNGNKILLFGNGGSAADAQHIAAEIIGRYKTERKGLPAIAITTDSSVMTSIGNDYGFLHIFDRQIKALTNKGDLLIAISTGGNSENVVNALKISKNLGCKTIGLSGRKGGEFNSLCDLNIIIPSDDTPRIQEMHILVGHIICHLIDQSFT